MSKYNIDFLESYNETTLGPIQKGEALFLYGLCEMVKPQIVLEIGCLIGQSLRVWINAGVPFIYAVDAVISEEVKELQRNYGKDEFGMDRILLIEQDMKKEISFLRFDDKVVPYMCNPDLVFIDASHNLEDNKAVVKNLLPILKPGALVIFHDTGHWKEDEVRYSLEKKEFLRNFGGEWDEEIGAWVHHPGEKKTIEWVSKNTKWERIDLWTTEVARYGLTLFQVPN